MRTRRASAAALAALLAATALSACRIVRTEDGRPTAAATEAAPNQPLDPASAAKEMFAARVVPSISEKAQAFTPTATGPVRLEGKVIRVDAASRTGLALVDTDNDGRADAAMQIGPVIQGTALRDALDFVSFGDFANQVDYARFGAALNAELVATQLAPLEGQNLAGRTITVVGVVDGRAGDLPRITPAHIELGAAS